jgi:CheY-like chemotaxis protein
MKKYKIIIVENDEDEQFFMQKEFKDSNSFELLTMAENGNELLKWLEAHPHSLPDLILSDLNMPGKNGYDIIKEVKRRDIYGHIPVVITSTYSTPTIMNECLSLGAAAYIVKPETFIAYAPFINELSEKIKTLEIA